MKTSFLIKDILFIVRLLVGFILIVVGLVGLIFPIFPDWILIVVGLLFFDINGHIARAMVKFLPKKFQKKASLLSLKTEKKIDKVFGSEGGDELSGTRIIK